MAETIVSVIAEKLLCKVMSLTSNEVSLGWGVKNDVQEFAGTLTTIKAVLLDAEDKQTQNEKLRVWLEKLKEVCYDVEDVLDEIEVKDLCNQVMNGQSISREDSMEKAIKNKVAKAVVPAIDVMFQALSEFGSKIVPPKRILKMLPELFDHQDQNVRACSKGLTLELCRWIGKDPVKSILFEKMRDTMKKELEAELVNVMGTARATRKIRSEQDKEPEQETVFENVGLGASEESAVGAPQEIDEYELIDPVDISTPLEKSGFWEGVKATKWLERKEAVAELTKLASTKKIPSVIFQKFARP